MLISISTGWAVETLNKKVHNRNTAMAKFAADADFPQGKNMLTCLFSSKTEDIIPEQYSSPKLTSGLPKYKRNDKCN